MSCLVVPVLKAGKPVKLEVEEQGNSIVAHRYRGIDWAKASFGPKAPDSSVDSNSLDI